MLVAGAMVLIIALVHLAAIFIGAPAFEYLDAPELAEAMREGRTTIPIALTSAVIVVMLVFGVYTLSGAGLIRPLPRLRMMLGIIGGIFVLRGLAVIWFVYLVVSDSPDAIPREIHFSLVSLAIGVLVLLGRRKLPKPE
jgi:hypothetical protein